MTPSEFREDVWCWWKQNDWATVWWKNFDDMLSRFDLIPERYGRTDGRTDGQTDGQICYINCREMLHWFVEEFLTACSRRLYPVNDFEFLQDSVPSHRAKVTQQFLRRNTPDFIAADDEWASYSPYLNPLNYCIWDILHDLVYEARGDFSLQIYRTSKRK